MLLWALEKGRAVLGQSFELAIWKSDLKENESIRLYVASLTAKTFQYYKGVVL
jgi:hypothetical protein